MCTLCGTGNLIDGYCVADLSYLKLDNTIATTATDFTTLVTATGTTTCNIFDIRKEFCNVCTTADKHYYNSKC